MKRDMHCPKCKHEFEIEWNWDAGECPQCHLEYYWDEQCTQDYSDCWDTIEWEKF
jgi:hypothetical protein